MTYSIVARSVDGKLVGVATVSGSVAVGSRVPWAKAGVGAVATQAYTNPALGPAILSFLEEGLEPREALWRALGADSGREARQVAVISVDGRSAVFSGSSIPREFGEYVGANCVCIANLVVSSSIAREMCRSFEEAIELGRSFVEALLSAIETGHDLGGDARGDRSAAIVVSGPTPYGKLYDRIIDARVDLSEDPLRDLKRILRALAR